MLRTPARSLAALTGSRSPGGFYLSGACFTIMAGLEFQHSPESPSVPEEGYQILSLPPRTKMLQQLPLVPPLPVLFCVNATLSTAQLLMADDGQKFIVYPGFDFTQDSP
ncbi:hypothetical protein T4D_14050 [Trichinella pseudospiralis]|uniref:Uncharacterized protein n=1 Tax=Trichinella pseudospiralis TaxID=6337 RepID=A0A0V1FEX9_TRIPS|nr:hypothetical protein T4D_14050 [Trichinella pseudospiralis]